MKTIVTTESVFVLECFYPPYKDSRGQYTPGRWVSCYSWVYACGNDNVQLNLTKSTRERLAILKAKAQGWTGRRDALNLHHEGLAYIDRKDAVAALRYIRRYDTCKYKVRIVRETVWKEHIVFKQSEKLPAPFKKAKP